MATLTTSWLPREGGRRATLLVVAAAMVGVGVVHFARPEPFVRIVPPGFPAPAALVAVSGFFEILGGLGLVVPRTRRFAALGLIALYASVFPANVYMAMAEVQPVPGVTVPVWAMWARLPFQFVFMGVAYWLSRPEGSPS